MKRQLLIQGDVCDDIETGLFSFNAYRVLEGVSDEIRRFDGHNIFNIIKMMKNGESISQDDFVYLLNVLSDSEFLGAIEKYVNENVQYNITNIQRQKLLDLFSGISYNSNYSGDGYFKIGNFVKQVILFLTAHVGNGLVRLDKSKIGESFPLKDIFAFVNGNLEYKFIRIAGKDLMLLYNQLFNVNISERYIGHGILHISFNIDGTDKYGYYDKDLKSIIGGFFDELGDILNIDGELIFGANSQYRVGSDQRKSVMLYNKEGNNVSNKYPNLYNYLTGINNSSNTNNRGNNNSRPTNNQNSEEPSIDDILANIRRILSEDEEEDQKVISPNGSGDDDVNQIVSQIGFEDVEYLNYDGLVNSKPYFPGLKTQPIKSSFDNDRDEEALMREWRVMSGKDDNDEIGAKGLNATALSGLSKAVISISRDAQSNVLGSRLSSGYVLNQDEIDGLLDKPKDQGVLEWEVMVDMAINDPGLVDSGSRNSLGIQPHPNGNETSERVAEIDKLLS